ncbi:hypothetical protein ACFQ3S_13455 [Mucilaginibacter terrae]|uniref:hypothetical protein n=1 Tax=Mucilaginibacter terrae TaxID=1955052 RepID=UPI00362D3936
MKYIVCLMLFCLTCVSQAKPVKLNTYKANHPYLSYVGRIDFKDPARPRFWSPGVYLQARFSGTALAIDLNDEVLWGKNHNYIEVVIDNRLPVRLQTTGKTNHIQLAKNLSAGIHTVTICKDTETGIGYLEFVGITCTKLLPWINKTKYKIELSVTL